MGIPATGASVAEVVGPEAAARIDAERSGAPMTWEPGQDVSVGQLVEARLGRVVVDRMVTPLLGGVYSTAADDLGVRATIPQLAEALDERGAGGAEFYLTDVVQQLLDQRAAKAAHTDAGARPPMFYGFESGYRRLIDVLREQSGAEVVIVTDEPQKYEGVQIPGTYGGEKVQVRHRDQLDDSEELTLTLYAFLTWIQDRLTMTLLAQMQGDDDE